MLYSPDQVTTNEPGYVIVFVDNNSIGTDVWFDNVQVAHYSGQVLEENHYYPFGLTISEEGNNTALPKQPYKYQGIELERNFGLETYETFYRGLDPQIGRFNSLDPLAEYFYNLSPYGSMNNDPVSYIDPDGSFSRICAWWRDIAWGGDGIAKDKKSGEWGVNYSYINTSGENVMSFIKTGSKPQTLEEGRALVAERWENLQDGLEMGTITQNEKGEFVRTVDGKSVNDEPSLGTRGKMLLNAIEPAVATSSPVDIAKLTSTAAKGGANLLKPLGLGSTGRTVAGNLTEQLAMKEIMSNPAMGRVIKTGLKDARWLGWSKMAWNNAGVEIHYVGKFENGVLKAVDDFKFIGGQ